MTPRSRLWIIETLPLGDAIDLSVIHRNRQLETFRKIKVVKKTWWERIFG